MCNIVRYHGWIAESIDLSPIEISQDLAELPTIEAVQKRLQSLIQNIGGYDVLAAAVPRYTAKMWQNRIEQTGRFKLLFNDFRLLADFFKDSVLIALFGHQFGLAYIDLNEIPHSEYSLADLLWALRRYQAQTQLLACDLREKQMDGESTRDVEARLSLIAKESIVLLRQLSIAFKAHTSPPYILRKIECVTLQEKHMKRRSLDVTRCSERRNCRGVSERHICSESYGI